MDYLGWGTDDALNDRLLCAAMRCISTDVIISYGVGDDILSSQLITANYSSSRNLYYVTQDGCVK